MVRFKKPSCPDNYGKGPKSGMKLQVEDNFIDLGVDSDKSVSDEPEDADLASLGKFKGLTDCIRVQKHYQKFGKGPVPKAIGFWKPLCADDGSFKPVQCSKGL